MRKMLRCDEDRRLLYKKQIACFCLPKPLPIFQAVVDKKKTISYNLKQNMFGFKSHYKRYILTLRGTTMKRGQS